jgi:hypothetical protein
MPKWRYGNLSFCLNDLWLKMLPDLKQENSYVSVEGWFPTAPVCMCCT